MLRLSPLMVDCRLRRRISRTRVEALLFRKSAVTAVGAVASLSPSLVRCRSIVDVTVFELLG